MNHATQRINPTLFAFTPDCRLKRGECNCTLYDSGAKLAVTGLPREGTPVLNVKVKEQLRGLNGNQITMSYDDAKTLGLDVDVVWSNGCPTDVVHVTKITD